MPRSLEEKVIIVTGGTSGIGKATCEALATYNPVHIFLLSRNTKEGAAIIEKIHTTSPDVLATFIPCDLSSFASIRQAVANFALLSPRLHLLFCNSGLGLVAPALTEDGYEMHFGTNHLGHALLIKLLMPTLLKTAAQPPDDVRIIIVSCSAHVLAPKQGIVFEDLRTTQANLSAKQRYAQSKLANTLYARELARNYPAIKTVSVDPGTVDTNLIYHKKKKYMRFERLIRVTTSISNTIYRKAGKELLTPEEGAQTSLWAATVPATDVISGEYYERVGISGNAGAIATNSRLAAKLWDWTQRIVTGVPFEEGYSIE